MEGNLARDADILPCLWDGRLLKCSNLAKRIARETGAVDLPKNAEVQIPVDSRKGMGFCSEAELLTSGRSSASLPQDFSPVLHHFVLV